MALGHGGVVCPSRESNHPALASASAPSLSKEGSHLLNLLRILDFRLNSLSRECALPCVLAFQMHPLT